MKATVQVHRRAALLDVNGFKCSAIPVVWGRRYDPGCLPVTAWSGRQRKGVVYEIPCQDCEHVYIGETGRTLQKRVTEHRSAVRRFDKNNGIAVHAWNEDHAVDWEAARIISTAPHYWNRRTLEAIHIQQRSPTMNLDCDLHINPIWNPILPASSLPPMSPTPD